eukprot:TRINITY_DN6912_c0_g1_i1.p1 TRINITY_DN6912_c0_g1~~TRINITY_DN6912_c0_g1_i1.p1  ORF type:complete len:189 (-),score=50.98 TRINITY_DN6912_c0_g1_i1:15-581(-)
MEREEYLKRVLALHGHRVAAYKKWEFGFRRYTEGEIRFNVFGDLVKQVTQEFVKISTEVKDIQTKLGELGFNEASKQIETLQQYEKQKLMQTTQYQSIKEKLELAKRSCELIKQQEEEEQHHDHSGHNCSMHVHKKNKSIQNNVDMWQVVSEMKTLEEEVASAQSTIDETIENINNTIEEIRIELYNN